MFGVPFILQVPREGMEYDRLYQLVLDRIRRCLKLTSVAVDSDPADARSMSPSNDSNMDERGQGTDQSTQDAENGNEPRPMETNGLEAPLFHASKLFTLDLVNLNGSTSLGKLKPNGKPIQLNRKSILCPYCFILFANFILILQLEASSPASGTQLLRKHASIQRLQRTTTRILRPSNGSMRRSKFSSSGSA